MAADPRLLNRINLYYWAPNAECWGHTALGLGDGTHISWWPSTAIGANKKFIGLAPAAVFTEWVPPNPDQTLAKDTLYEDHQPAILAIPVALDVGKIKLWWDRFRVSQKYNAARLNCSTTVFLALKHGGALTYVDDPGNWWWDPDRVLQFTRTLVQAITQKKKGRVQFQQPAAAFAQQLQRARQQADLNAQRAKYQPALQ